MDQIDLWIMRKFEVLPTDPRFLSMYEEQKIAFFRQMNLLSKDEDIARHIRKMSQLDRIKDKKTESIISSGGKKRLRKIFQAQGLSPDDIDLRINDLANKVKKTQLANEEKSND